MKKYLLLFVAFLVSAASFCAEPDLNDVTFYSESGRETLDFYREYSKVVYYSKDARISRPGDYQVGTRERRSVGDTSQKPLTVNISVGNRVTTLKGTVSYSRTTGRVYSLTLNGRTWTRR